MCAHFGEFRCAVASVIHELKLPLGLYKAFKEIWPPIKFSVGKKLSRPESFYVMTERRNTRPSSLLPDWSTASAHLRQFIRLHDKC